MRTSAMAIAILLAAAMSASAQSGAGDPRWTPWLGCWDPVQGSGTARVCVTTAGPNAVSLATTVEGQPVLEQTLTADGMDHPVTDAECSGTQQAEWSADGLRLYAHAELTCGDQKPREVSGLSMIAPGGAWLDIQAVKIDGRETTRVRRYRRVPSATATAGSPGAVLTLAGVKEASSRVTPQVIEAALTETRARFDLTSRALIDLADAHVPDAVIDVVVALSYPQHFVVERTAAAAPSVPFLPIDEDPFLLGWAFGSGYYSGLYPAYYYTPFAYAYSGFYFPYAYGSVAVGSGDDGHAHDDFHGVRPSGAGRVVDGLGYTRVRPRDDTQAQPAGSTTGGATAASRAPAAVSGRGYTSNASSQPSDTGASGSSSGSSSGSNSSSGSSGDSGGGRTAVPR